MYGQLPANLSSGGSSGSPALTLRGLLLDGNTAANWRAGVGQTDDGGGLCSNWANQLGAMPALTAVTTARPTIQADGSLLFDGTANRMLTGATTLNQPETIYFVGRQVTWTDTEGIFDGVSLATGELIQTTTTPRVDITAGLAVAANTGLIVNTYTVVTAIFNGASSSLQMNTAAATTGNAGAANMGGFVLGANGASLLFSNIQVKEVIIRRVSDSAALQLQIQRLLGQVYGIVV